MDSRKQAVSIRMSAADVRNVKKLAKRLGARDSDVIRFAVKAMLSKLAPLFDPSVKGRALVPVFLESGSDIFRYLDLDAARLESIINEGVEDHGRVEPDDIHLIAMSGIQRSYVKLRLGSMNTGRTSEEARVADSDEVDNTLRQYLYDKYIFRSNGHSTSVNGKEEKR